MASTLRQEQLPADPDITEVAPGVLRMQLPIKMPGLGHVNMYALLDKRGAAVMDPGMPGPANWRALVAHLGKAGLRVRDVHTVIVTHSHPDHFGGAAKLARESGASIVTHEAFSTWFEAHPDEDTSDADAIDSNEEAIDRFKRAPMAWDASAWGGDSFRPPLGRRLMFRFLRPVMRRVMVAPRPAERLEDGQVISLCNRDWVAIHTPGHTLDHLCLYDPVEGVLFSGDHVLPTITPHIAGLGEGFDTLDLFLSSLRKVEGLEGVRHVLPAHGHPFMDLGGRIGEIHEHHHSRMDRLKEASDELGPATISDLSQKLFRPERWGFMAESETFAHVNHLLSLGEAECIEADGPPQYVITRAAGEREPAERSAAHD